MDEAAAGIADEKHTGMRMIGTCAGEKGVFGLNAGDELLLEQKFERAINGWRRECSAQLFFQPLDQIVSADCLISLPQRFEDRPSDRGELDTSCLAGALRRAQGIANSLALSGSGPSWGVKHR